MNHDEKVIPPGEVVVEQVRLDHLIAWLRHTSQMATLWAAALEDSGLDGSLVIPLKPITHIGQTVSSARTCPDDPIGGRTLG